MFFMLSISLAYLATGNSQPTFDVGKFGAAGDGETDDSPALHFHRCNDLRLSGLTHLNSQKNHIGIHNCRGVSISNLHIIAPSDSPNTDGIDISLSTQILISNTFIGTGDDCIAIKGGTSNVKFTRVTCGPGHGIREEQGLQEGITLIASGNPIVIDQHYCNGRDHHCQDQEKAVAISGVTFSGFQGTSADVEAINLDCSKHH
ncbi:hypothetical protein V6N13_063762 [Hibiscus sabdariffa]